jgi:putative endonuclease
MSTTNKPRYWRHSKGQHNEELALAFLQQQGLHLVTRNFRSRFGELDLVMTDQRSLVFVEVRYRRQTKFGSACGTVDFAKQARLRNAARYFLLHHPNWAQWPCRFDVLGLEGISTQPTIEWLQNAFY